MRFSLTDTFKGPGSYDWGIADRSIAVAAKHSKKVGLSFSGGTNWPVWVYDKGAVKHSVTTRKGVLTMPWPFDPVSSKYFLEWIAAAGAHFDSNATVGYVNLDNMGQVGGESFVIWNGTDVPPEEKAAFDKDGGADAWVAIGKTFAGAYHTAFKTTPFLITADVPEEGADEQLNQLCDYIAKQYPHHGGFANASWTAHFDENTGFEPWQIIKNYAATNPTMLQQAHSAASGGFNGTVPDGISGAASKGVQILEIYPGDFLPANSAAIKDFNAAK